MQVILLKDVDHVGLRGDVISVARGYARNFLLPRKLAEVATPARVAELEKRDAQRARHEAKTMDDAQAIAATLEQTVLRFEVKAGPTGSLFGSVTPTDIVDELWQSKKIRVDRRKVDTAPLKRIGRYSIPVDIFQDVRVELRTEVIPEGGELPSEEELEAMEAAERAEHEPEGEDHHELEEALAAEDAAEDAPEAETAEPAEPEAEAEPEPEWRADAEAALADE
jgi:large subunit ribosomal protein L9